MDYRKVDHCLLRDDLRNIDDKCMLRISKVLLIIVTALNMVKCNFVVLLLWDDAIFGEIVFALL